MNIDLDDEDQLEAIINKFKEIKYNDGLIVIEELINNYYDENLIKNIILSLTKNKRINTHLIYDYIVKHTSFEFETILNLYDDCIIHLSAIEGNIQLLKYLIDSGMDVDTSNNVGRYSPFYYACVYSNLSNIDTVDFLLENGADIDFLDISKHTALYCLCNENLLIISIDRGLYIYGSRRTPKKINTQMIEYLLYNGADPNYAPLWPQRDSPLIKSLSLRNNVDATRLLLEYGADPNLYYPLCECIFGYDSCDNDYFYIYDKIKLLLEYGAENIYRTLHTETDKTSLFISKNKEIKKLIKNYYKKKYLKEKNKKNGLKWIYDPINETIEIYPITIKKN